MERRRFLKLTSLAALGAALISPLDVLPASGATRLATLNGVAYRGDRRGRIFSSTNGGATWKLHATFGPRYSVKNLVVDRSGGIRATLVFRRRSFVLVLSPDQQRWLTI